MMHQQPNRFLRLLRRQFRAPVASVILACFALWSASPGRGGNTWTGGGTTTNWSDTGNWGGAFPTYGTLTFTTGGTQGTTSVVDASINMNQMLWTGTSPWTLNSSGGAVISLFDNGGTQAKIENQSTGLVTINAPVTFAATAGNAWGEINAVNGDITFGSGTLTVNGSAVNGIKMFSSGRTITYNNTVSAAGKWFATTGATGMTMNVGGAFTSGDLYIMNGSTLKLNTGGTITTSGLRLGGDFGTTLTQDLTKGATFQLTSLTGGQSFGSIINTVTGNTSGALLIDSLATSGTNTLSGNIFLDSNLRINQATGGTLAVSGVISNAAGFTKIGGGTLDLQSANTFSGAMVLDGGTVKLGGNGTAASTSSVTIGNRSTLTLDNSVTNNGNRTAGALASSGGTINFIGNAAATTETLGALTLSTGALTINSTPGAGGSTLTIPSIARAANGGTLFVSGTGLGTAANSVVATTAPTLANSILKYAVVSNGTVTRFATHAGNGTTLAPLTTGYQAAESGWTAATVNALPTADATLAANRTAYSLTLDDTIDILTPAADRSLTLSGAVLQTGGTSVVDGNTTTGFDNILAFGANEAIFYTVGTLQLNRGNTNTLTGTGGFTKSGAGTLILNGVSTLSGAMNVNEGTLELRGGTSLMTTATGVNLNGATLRLFNDTATTYTGSWTVTADSSVIVSRATAASTATTHTLGTLSIGNGRTLSVTSNNINSGTGYGLTTGVLTLTTGGATIDVANNGAGTGTMTVAAPTGNFTLTKTNSGDLVTNSTTTGFSGPVTIQGGRVGWSGTSGTISEGQVLSGSGGILRNGSGGTTNLTGANTFTGGVTVTSGTLGFSTVSDNGGAASNLGQGTDGITMNGGTLNFIGSTSQSTNRAITMPATSTFGANGTSGAVITYTGGLSEAGTANDWTMTGAGAMTISTTPWLVADDFTMTGSGTTVLNLNTTGVYNTNGGTNTDAAMLIRNGTLNINANNAITSGTNAVNRITLADGTTAGTGTLNLNGFNQTINRIDLGAIATGFDGSIPAFAGSLLTVTSAININRGTIAVDMAGAAAVTKTGLGTVTLSGSNSGLTGTTLTLNAGTTTFDYVNSATAKVSTSSVLDMRGAVLTLNGNASNPVTQALASTTLASGGANTISLTSNGQATNLSLGAITRAMLASAGTLRVNLPASGNVTTTNANTNGILGGWATATTSAGVTNFAANDGSNNIIGVTSTTQDAVGSWAAGQHITDSSGYTGTLASDLSINSLRFNANAASAVAIAPGKTLSVASGGILMTSAAATGAHTISGGTLTPTLVTSGGGELIVTQDSAQGLAISSRILTRGLTKTGTGTLTLSGSSNYLGIIPVQAGTLVASGGSAVGDTNPVTLADDQSNIFQITSNETIGTLAGGNTATGIVVGTVDVGANALTINETTATTFTGTFSGTGTLVKSGAAALTYTGNNPVPFTGTVRVDQGTLTLSGAAAQFSSATAVIINGSGILSDSQDQSSSQNRINDAATVLMNNTALGGFTFTHNQTSARSESVGALTLGAGHNTITSNATAAASGSLTFASLAAVNNHATVLVRGPGLGDSATTQRGQVIFTAAPSGGLAAVGGTGTPATQFPIFPYMIGDTSATGNGNSFVRNTGATNGLKPLAAAEYVTDAAGFNALTGAALDNVRFATNPGAALTGTATAINSLALDGASAITLTGPAGALSITSGAILSAQAVANQIDTFTGITTSGASRDYTIYVTDPAGSLTINSPLTTAAPLVKSGAGTLVLGNGVAITNSTTDIYFNQGAVQVDSLAKLGTGTLNFFGGSLKFAAGFDPSSRTITLGTGGGTFDTNGITNVTFANSIGNGGAGNLTKAGVGTLTLGAAVNFTGSAVVSAGTLQYGVAAALPTTTGVTLSGGTLDTSTFGGTLGGLSVQASSTVTGSAALNFTGDVFVGGGAAQTLTVNNSGGTTLSGSTMYLVDTGTTARTMTLAGTGPVTIASSIVDGTAAGSLTVTNSGITTLSGQNIYTGTTTMNAGAGTLKFSGSNLSTGATTLTTGTLQLDNAVNGGLATGTLTLTAGTVQALNAGRTLSNNTVQGGAVTVSGSQNLTINGSYTNSGGSRTLTNSITGGQALTLAGPVYLSEASGTGRTFTLAGTAPTTISGAIADFNGSGTAGNFTVTNTATTNLGGTNTYSGTTTFTGGAATTTATIKLSGGSAIPDGSGKGNVTINPVSGAAVILDLNGTSESINGLTATTAGSLVTIDNTSASAASLTFGGNNANVAFGNASGTFAISNSGGGALSITKTGSGTGTITDGSLTYTGTTNVTGGSLSISTPVNGTTGLAVSGTGSMLALTGGITTPSAITSVAVGTGSTLSLLDGVGTRLESLTSLSIGTASGTNTSFNFNVGDSVVIGDNLNTDLLKLASGTLSLFTGNTVTFNLTDAGLNPNTDYILLDAAAIGGGFFGGASPHASISSYLLGTTPGGFTAMDLTTSSTTNQIILRTGNLITGNSYFTGITNNAWNANVNNWSTDKPGTLVAASIPGQGTDVVFRADNAVTATLSTTLEQNFKINSLTFEASTVGANTPTSITVGPGAVTTNRLEIAPQNSTDGINVATGGTSSVTLSAPLRLGNAQTWNVADSTSTIIVSGALQGAADVTKTGPGKVTLSAAADPAAFNLAQTVDFNVSAGTLEMTNIAALGTTADANLARVNVSGGAFYYNNATTGTVPNPLTLSGGALSAGGAAHTYSGNVTTSGTSTINMRDLNSATLTTTQRNITLSGTISGGGSLTIDSINTVSGGNQVNGSLVVSGANPSWSGGFKLLRGTIDSRQESSLGTGAAAVELGRILFKGANGATWSQFGNGLTLDATTGNAVVELQADNQAGTPTTLFTNNITGTVTLGGSGAAPFLRVYNADAFSTTTIGGSVVLAANGSIHTSGAAAGTPGNVVAINGAISETGGSRSLTLNGDTAWGSNTYQLLSLNGNNSYTGGTTWTAGTVILGHKNGFGTNTVAINGTNTLQASLDLSSTGSGPVPNAVTLSNNLTVSGANSITLSGLTTQSGGNRTLTNSLTAGMLRLGSVNLAEGTTARTLTVTGAGATVFGTVTNNGANNVITYNGTGSFAIDTNIFLSDVTGTGRTLTINGTGNTSVTGVIANFSGGAGTGGILTKAGGGVLTLSNSGNTYTGGTNVNSGTLRTTANNVLPNTGTITVNATTAGTALLDLNGNNDTIAALTLGGTSGLATSVNQVTTGAGTLTLGGTLTVSATGNWTTPATISGNLALGTANRTVSVANSTGTDVDLDIQAVVSGSSQGITKSGAGTLLLSAANLYTGATVVNAGVVRYGVNSAINSASAVTVNASAASTTATLDLNNFNGTVASLTIGGTGQTATSASVIQTGTGTLTLGGNVTTSATGNPTATPVITGNLSLGAAARTFDVADSTGSLVDLNVSATITGTGSLVKTSGGVLQLSGSGNSFSGGVTINATSGLNRGVIAATSTDALGTGPVTAIFGTGATAAQIVFTGGITLGNSGFTTSGVGTDGTTSGILRSVSGSNIISGNLSLGGGGGSSTYRADTGASLTVNGFTGAVVAGARDMTLVGGGDFVFGGVIRDSNQANILDQINIIASNTGTVSLNNTNTYTGTTTANAGSTLIAGSTQAFGIGSATTVHGTLQLAGNSNSLGSLAGSATGIVENANASSATLAAGVDGTSTIFAGVIQDGTGGGALAFTKSGGGTLTLTGPNSYSGSTSITGGTLQIGNGGTTGSIGGAAVTNDGALVFNRSDAISFANTISGTGTVTMSGGGTLTLGGTNSYSGKTTVASGTISIATVNATATANQALGTHTDLDLGVAATSSGRLLYTGAADTLAKNINVLGSGSDTIENGGTGLLTLSGTITKAGTTLTLLGGASGIDVTGSIVGAPSSSDLIIGGGVVTLSAANTFNGPAILNAGTLNINHAGAIPTALTINGGTLDNTSGSAITLTSNPALNFNSDFTFTGSNNLNLGTGAVTLSGNRVVSMTAGVLTVGGAIGGAYNLTGNGAGTLALTGSNTYTGSTTISGASTFEITTDGALGGTGAGTTVVGGASLHLNNVTYSSAEPLNLNGSGIGGNGALRNTGTSSFAGPITAQTDSTIHAGGGALTLTGGIDKTGTILTLTGGGTININTNGITGNTGTPNSDLVVSATTVNLNTANTYNGPTYIRSGGTINANVANALPTANGRTDVTLDDTGSGSSTLSLSASQSAASLSGAASSSVILGSSTLTVGKTSGDTTFAGTISGTGGSLVKDLASTLTLTSLSTYTGGTTVSGGTLNITNTTGSATGSGGVTIGPSGTLAGTGRVEAAAGEFIFMNGTLIVGDSTAVSPVASELTLSTSGAGGTVLGAASSLYFDLFSRGGDLTGDPTSADRIKLFGTMDATLGGTLVLYNPNSLGGFADGDQWTLFDLSGPGSITGTLSVNYASLGLGPMLGGVFNQSTGVFAIVAVPEPSRALLMLLGLAGIGLRRRRR